MESAHKVSRKPKKQQQNIVKIQLPEMHLTKALNDQSQLENRKKCEARYKEDFFNKPQQQMLMNSPLMHTIPQPF